MKYIILFTALLFSFFSKAEQIKGTILTNDTNSPIAYVNIGILGKGIGTVSDENGNFYLDLSPNSNKDTLAFSMVGYGVLKMLVKEVKEQCKKDCKFQLKATNYDLKPIELNSNKLKRKTVGIDDPKESVSIGYTGESLGQEIGIKMKVKRPAFIYQVNFHIARCSQDSVKFRVNIYNEKNGLPEKNILEKPIYISCSCQDILNGFELKLTKQTIYVEDDFFVTLEDITQSTETKGFFFKGKFFSGGTYHRLASQGRWSRIGIVGAGISAVILEEE